MGPVGRHAVIVVNRGQKQQLLFLRQWTATDGKSGRKICEAANGKIRDKMYANL